MQLPITFCIAKNGEQTCSYNNIFLHSSYNPKKEAERFVQTRQCNFDPINIIITEPCLSYCAEYFKIIYPNAKLFAIRYSNSFDKYNNVWDNVFYLSDKYTLSNQLYDYFGEDGLLCTFFTSWTSSEKPFIDYYNLAWSEIKKALIKSQSVLTTRSYFAKRWLKNTMKFCSYVNKTAQVIKGNSPIIITASGPSLQSSLPYLKKYRNTFFLIGVSSSLSVLLQNDITPDLCISTDGGYWAKVHLSHYLSQNKSIPLLLNPEGACYAELLENYTIIPMYYGDGFATDFLPFFSNWAKAYRNGTVSGTAAEYALTITTGPVYFCGLDLASSSGYAHSQPNELELFNSTNDYRLKPLQTRITPYSFESPSLDIYRDWFKSKSFSGRLKRLSDNYCYKNDLNEITDINWQQYINQVSSINTDKPKIINDTINQCCLETKLKKIKETTLKNLYNPNWIKELFPADYNLYRRAISKQQSDEILSIITNKINALQKELKLDI